MLTVGQLITSSYLLKVLLKRTCLFNRNAIWETHWTGQQKKIQIFWNNTEKKLMQWSRGHIVENCHYCRRRLVMKRAYLVVEDMKVDRTLKSTIHVNNKTSSFCSDNCPNHHAASTFIFARVQNGAFASA